MTNPARIYLDNAATSWPKPPAVYEAMDRYQRELGAPAGRSAYAEASEVERAIGDARRLAAELIGTSEPKHIIFTLNGTDSLNLAIHGLLQAGDHIVTTVCEHNSVLRPLRALEVAGQIEVTRVGCNREGVVDPADVKAALKPNTRLVALVHVSNVTGAIQPAAEVGTICREAGVRFLLDAAQSLGELPLDAKALNVDLLAAPGHKGLLGPLGTGLLYIAPGVEQQLASIRQGGTGTQSENDTQPESLPDKYESGNHNVPGIVGLRAGLLYLKERGVAEIQAHQQELSTRLWEQLAGVSGISLYGPAEAQKRGGVVSLTIAGYDPQEVAGMLDAACHVQVRAGLHCAPLMHDALGTREQGGTVRLSIGPFNTPEHIDAAATALAQIAESAP